MAVDASRCRHWCFTWWEPDVPRERVFEGHDVEYYVIGNEIGPSCGRPHYQGFVSFIKNKRLTALKKINAKISWHPKRGTVQQASDYCKKDGDFYEYGIMPVDSGQATQNKWDVTLDLIRMGKFSEIDSDILIRYTGNVYKLFAMLYKCPKVINKKTGIWIWGAPGTGKSRYARTRWPDAYEKMDGKWFDQYVGEPVVLIDELHMDEARQQTTRLKKLLDHYDIRVEVKGYSVKIRPELVVITSQWHPEQIWLPEDTAAIVRRIDVYKFPEEKNLLPYVKCDGVSEEEELQGEALPTEDFQEDEEVCETFTETFFI